MSFNEWWSLYPRKVSKLVAMKAYDQMKKKGYADAELLTGIKRYVADLESSNTGMEFVPYPASWLRAGRWLDERTATLVAQQGVEHARNGGGILPVPEGYAAIIHRKIGSALFAAYFRDCTFGEQCIFAPSPARRDYILNKFAHRFRDQPLHIEVRE